MLHKRIVIFVSLSGPLAIPKDNMLWKGHFLTAEELKRTAAGAPGDGLAPHSSWLGRGLPSGRRDAVISLEVQAAANRCCDLGCSSKGPFQRDRQATQQPGTFLLKCSDPQDSQVAFLSPGKTAFGTLSD